MVDAGRSIARARYRRGSGGRRELRDTRCKKQPATAVSNGQIVNKSTKLEYLMVPDSVHKSSILQYNSHPQ